MKYKEGRHTQQHTVKKIKRNTVHMCREVYILVYTLKFYAFVEFTFSHRLKQKWIPHHLELVPAPPCPFYLKQGCDILQLIARNLQRTPGYFNINFI